MIFVQLYFLYRTNKYKLEYLYRLKHKLRTSNTQRSTKKLKVKVDVIFQNIRKQIMTFIAFLFYFLPIFFGHYYIMKTVELDAFKNVSVFSFPPFFYNHVYQVVICILLVVFRIKVFQTKCFECLSKSSSENNNVLRNDFTVETSFNE